MGWNPLIELGLAVQTNGTTSLTPFNSAVFTQKIYAMLQVVVGYGHMFARLIDQRVRCRRGIFIGHFRIDYCWFVLFLIDQV